MRACATVHENQPDWPAGIGACLAGSVLIACACDALADPRDTIVVAAADLPRPRLEISAASLPRFDDFDGATRASLIDLTLLSQSRSGLGVALGVSHRSGRNPALRPTVTGTPLLDLGLHWRYTFDNQYRFDVTAYRRVPNSDAISLVESREPAYGARVELGMGSIAGRSKGFVADRGFLGFQLESGARLTVKRSGGKPMIYYRNTF